MNLKKPQRSGSHFLYCHHLIGSLHKGVQAFFCNLKVMIANETFPHPAAKRALNLNSAQTPDDHLAVFRENLQTIVGLSLHDNQGDKG
jgi:hypothetical protein